MKKHHKQEPYEELRLLVEDDLNITINEQQAKKLGKFLVKLYEHLSS